MIDIQLLRLMRVRSDYNKIVAAVDTNALEAKTKAVIKVIRAYYKKHSGHGQIDFSVLIPFMKRSVYPDLSDENLAIYTGILKNMARDYPDEHTRTCIMESIQDNNLAYKSYQLIDKYNSGEDVQLIDEMKALMDEYDQAVGLRALPEVDENIDDLIDSMGDDSGLRFRLECLNEAMRPLRGGDFGIIAARPDQGKTSFLASELTYMASQVTEERPILWFNNEGMGASIRARLMQSAMNCTSQELVDKKLAGTLYSDYHKAMGGKNKIRVMDVHGYNTGQIEAIIADTTPSLCLYDMIDNVHGFGDAARTDLQLEKMYQWAREKGVKYDSATLATSQISAEGADIMYPALGLLKDSKTGKQGACDFQLMIGSQESKPEMANTRWVSLPKNKLRKLRSSTLLEQVVFDRDRARYKDITLEEGS